MDRLEQRRLRLIRLAANRQKTVRRRIWRSLEVEALEQRLVLNATVQTLPSAALHGNRLERVDVRSAPHITQLSEDEMIRKWQAKEDHIFAQLTMAGAVIAGVAAVPQTFATGEILRGAFWKSLSKMEAAEASLEAIDYAKNFHEFISDPLASNATIHDALQKIVEGNLDWFTHHPPFYKLALGILAKGANQAPTPTPTPSPSPTSSILGTYTGNYSGTGEDPNNTSEGLDGLSSTSGTMRLQINTATALPGNPSGGTYYGMLTFTYFGTTYVQDVWGNFDILNSGAYNGFSLSIHDNNTLSAVSLNGTIGDGIISVTSLKLSVYPGGTEYSLYTFEPFMMILGH